MTVTVDERREILDALHVNLTEDLSRVWDQASSLSSDEFRALIIEAVPELSVQYETAAAEFAADWYTESAPELKYRPVVADPSPARQLRHSAEWALDAEGMKALDRIAGFTQRAVWNAARRTTIHNVKAESGAKWARTVSASACAFCAMLATRGGVYSYETVDFDSHDFCRCGAIEVRPGQSHTLPSYMEKYQDAYERAAAYSRTTNEKGYTDRKLILKMMRQSLGSH